MIEVKLTRVQAGLLALEDVPFGRLELVRIYGGYIWIRGGRGVLKSLRTRYREQAGTCPVAARAVAILSTALNDKGG